MDKSKELGQEKVFKLLIKFLIPALVGTLVNALYNIVDRIYIGRGVDALALAGLSVTFPIMIITAGFAMLIGMGGGVLVSINLGKKDKNKAEKILGNTFVLLCISAILVSLLCFAIKGPILKSFGASDSTITYANDYLSIILVGTIFQNLSFGMNNLIRSEGNAVTAMITMIIGAVLNIILDPIFIFVFHMGVQGAAIATIFSQFVNTVWVLSHFRGNKSVLKLKRENFKIEFDILKGILAIGMAPFAMQIAGSVINIIFNKQLMIYGGDLAVGAMGVINSIAMLLVMCMVAVNQAAQPIIGFNYGAKKYDRVKGTLKSAILVAMAFGLIGFIAVEVFPEVLIRAFNTDSEELLNIGVNGIRKFLFVLPLIGFQIVGSNYFQAIGRAKVSMVLSMLRQVIILIPLLLVLPSILKINGVWLAAPISDTLSSGITAVFLYNGLKLLDKEKEQIEKKIEAVVEV